MVKKIAKIIFDKLCLIVYQILGVNLYFPILKLKLLDTNSLFYSQGNQDVIILSFLRKNAIKLDKLRIVDIGANHPVKYNNTLLFEKLYDAEIYSIDAQYKFTEMYSNTRTSKFINCAVGGIREDIEFYIPSGNNGSHDNNMFASSNIDNIPMDLKVNIEKVIVKKCPLEDIIPQQHYDILFIDVEGFEYDVLNGIDFSKFSFEFICIENNRSRSEKWAIRNYLKNKNYSWVGRIFELDDIFQIHRI